MRYLACLTLLFVATGLSAQAPGNAPAPSNAFFAGPGTHGATLNNAPLLPGTAVLRGETVTTGPGGVAVLAPTHGTGGVVEMTANASATVRAGAVIAGASADQLQMTTGNALVHGNVSVLTAQGQTFQPASANTTFIVDAGTKQSSMGVESGAVTTFSPTAAARVIPAGAAVQVNTGANGAVNLSSIKLTQVVKPAVSAAVPANTPLSQRR